MSYLIFDIATAPLPDGASYLESPEPPANYKDPAKIAAWIEEATAKQIAKMALDPDLCWVSAIGSEPGGTTVGPLDTEAKRLREWWDRAEQWPVLGFNCLAFDLPVLIRRSQYLGLRIPPLELGRYRHPYVIDLLDELTFQGRLPARSLDFYCRRFGIDIQKPIAGADEPQLALEGRWDDLTDNVSADVQRIGALAQKVRAGMEAD